jgi:cell division septal protein FtsQ
MLQQRKKVTKRPKQVRFYLRKYLKIGKVVLLTAVLLGFTFSFYYLLFRSRYFSINEVRVEGAVQFVSSTDLVEVVKGKTFGKSIFSFDTKELSDGIEETFLGAKEIVVYKVYPTTIGVRVREREPLALIYNDSSPDFFMVDEDGYVLGMVDAEKSSLPKIRYDPEIRVGYFVDRTMVPVYMELVEALNGESVKATSISFYPKYALVYIKDGPEVYFKNDRNKKESVKILNMLLKQLAVQGEKVKKVDLRYDKISVSYD